MIEEFLTIALGAGLLRSYAPSVFNGILGKFTPVPMAPKDPHDLTLTTSSTEWKSEDYCPKCKATVSSNEALAHVCNSCGHLFANILGFKKRTFRQLWDGKNWVHQYNYDNNPDHMEVIEKAYKVMTPRK